MWTPAQPSLDPPPLERVVDDYAAFLLTRSPEHASRFNLRLRSMPDAARAEAVVFSWLRARRLDPEVFEDGAGGGPDFACRRDGGDGFFVEVTSLNAEAASQRAGWLDGQSRDGFWFSDIADKLAAKVGAKARQLAGRDAPRVLAICCRHLSAGCLLGPLACEQLLVSRERITVPVGCEAGEAEVTTDLRHAAFVTLRGGEVIPKRQSISAVLLVAIWDDQIDVAGVLHPSPAVVFDYGHIPEVPFARLQWPPQNGELETEWVISSPRAKPFHHQCVVPTPSELRAQL